MNCYQCGVSNEMEDNYCRRCGAALRSARLPVPRESYDLAPWPPLAGLATRGAVALAAGTFLPWLLGRLARRVLASRLSRPVGVARKQPTAPAPARKGTNGESPQEATVGEFILFRRVIFRR